MLQTEHEVQTIVLRECHQIPFQLSQAHHLVQGWCGAWRYVTCYSINFVDDDQVGQPGPQCRPGVNSVGYFVLQGLASPVIACIDLICTIAAVLGNCMGQSCLAQSCHSHQSGLFLHFVSPGDGNMLAM